MVPSAVSSIVTTTTGKAFLIAPPAVIAGSLLLNDRFVCPSTRNRKRSSVGRACPFGFSAAGGFWSRHYRSCKHCDLRRWQGVTQAPMIGCNRFTVWRNPDAAFASCGRDWIEINEAAACLTEKNSKSVVGSPSDPTRPFVSFAFYLEKKILWNSEVTINLKARAIPRQAADHAPHSFTARQNDSSRLSGLRPIGSSLF
jgi:hypothetical protein